MKFVVAVSLLFITTFLLAQGEDTAITCTAGWKKGEEKIILITRSKVNIPVRQETPDFKMNYEAHLTILDSSADGYKIQWVFQLPALVKLANPEFAKAMIVYNGLKMIFTTTNEGEFKELLNWEEVRQAYIDMAMVSVPKENSEVVKKAFEQTKTLFSTRELVESSLIKEIQLFHAPYGGYFTKTGIKQNAELPNPFGGEPIPIFSVQKLTEMKPYPGNYRITYSMEIDSAGAAPIMAGLFKKLDLPTDSIQHMIEETLSALKVSDHSEYSVSQPSGWMKNIKYERSSMIENRKQTETLLLKLK